MKVYGTNLDPIMFSPKTKEKDEATIKEKLSTLKQELIDLKKKKRNGLHQRFIIFPFLIFIMKKVTMNR